MPVFNFIMSQKSRIEVIGLSSTVMLDWQNFHNDTRLKNMQVIVSQVKKMNFF